MSVSILNRFSRVFLPLPWYSWKRYWKRVSILNRFSRVFLLHERGGEEVVEIDKFQSLTGFRGFFYKTEYLEANFAKIDCFNP